METIEEIEMQFLLCTRGSYQPSNLSVIHKHNRSKVAREILLFIFSAFSCKCIFKVKPKLSYFSVTTNGLGFFWADFSYSKAV